MTRKAHKNGNTPATQADLALLAGEMALRFDGVNVELQEIRVEIKEVREEMRIEFREVRGDIASLKRGLEAVLNVVTSIDEQLRELKTLPVRVARLERSRR